MIDFAPLVDRLQDTHRVVVVEPLGYGLSDGTDRPRTSANIVDEVHQALSTLGIDRYVLAGHSVAGIYALEYTNTYPDEVQAFVGIDSRCRRSPASTKPSGLACSAS
ncbi:alpha/beta hydrolase [Sphingomonas sp. LR61]|uniref:alpha/beta fold hydrolase n=1 Tax=Sphingomonas sp. LR61 TaxID=3050234 RepID=UPI002FDF8E5C